MSLFEDTYKTISGNSEGIFKDRGSKFIAYAFPVISEEDVKQHLSKIKKEHHSARHHCFAYRLGHDKSAYRVNDDGEPSGTAGKPIYSQILSHDLTNILIIVVRYFGGTLLGTGGLVNAYRTSAKEAVENNKIITKTVNEQYEITFSYPEISPVMKILKEEQVKIISQKSEMNCNIIFTIRKNSAGKIQDKLKTIKGLTLKYLKTI